MAKNKKRAPVGRPLKYDPSYCEIAELKSSQGFSIPVIGLHCGKVDRSTIHEWADAYPEFSDALKSGRAKRLERLEFMITCHQSGHKTKDFNPKESSLPAILFELKCRFHEDWSDKQKILDMIRRSGGQVNLNIDSAPLDILSIVSDVKVNKKKK